MGLEVGNDGWFIKAPEGGHASECPNAGSESSHKHCPRTGSEVANRETKDRVPPDGAAVEGKKMEIKAKIGVEVEGSLTKPDPESGWAKGVENFRVFLYKDGHRLELTDWLSQQESDNIFDEYREALDTPHEEE